MVSYIEHLKNMIKEINDKSILIVGDYNFPDAFINKNLVNFYKNLISNKNARKLIIKEI